MEKRNQLLLLTIFLLTWAIDVLFDAGAPVQLKRTEKEAAKPTEKEAVKLTGKKEGKPTRVHVHERTGRTRRPPVNKRVMKTLEQLRAINWSCPRRLGEQMKDAETGDQGARWIDLWEVCQKWLSGLICVELV